MTYLKTAFGIQDALTRPFVRDRSVSFSNASKLPNVRHGEINVMRAKPARVTEIAAETIDARLLLKVLSDFKKGDFTTRLPSEQTGLTGKIYDALNEVVEINEIGRAHV